MADQHTEVPCVFVAEDFDELNIWTAEDIAVVANKTLAEIAKVVYGEKIKSTGAFIWTDPEYTYPASELNHVLGATHRALLVGIEELKPKVCEHEPLAVETVLGTTFKPKCKYCSAKLKYTWSVCDE